MPIQLIDREATVADVAALLAHERLVTLVGAGGCGKTSVALAIGHAARGSFRDGVWWIDLGGVTDPDLVPSTIAVAVGATLRPAGPLDSVRHNIGDDNVLFIVDNCEQVAGAVASAVETLIKDCRHLHILTTSRQLLNLSFEVARAVEPLAVSGTLEDPDDNCPAVRLFAERAAAGPSGFRLDASNIRPVWEVCRKLDGVPLAIELAAARCRTMSPAEIAQQLADDFSSLVTDRRDAPPRQQSLEASLSWSWGLLDDSEQRLAARLAVLPADFELEAAAAAADEPKRVVLGRLTALHDHSLLTVIQRSGRTRYRMLDAVREYAARRLADDHETAATRSRVLTWSVLRAEALVAGPPDEAIASLDAEMPTFRSGLDHAIATGATELGLRLATALTPVWSARYPLEGLGRFRSLLDSGSGGDARTAGLIQGMFLATIAFDFVSAQTWATEALTRGGDDDRVLATASHMLMRSARARGDVETALEYLASAVDACARLGDAAGVVACKFADCEIALLSGEFKRAMRAAAEAVSIARQSGQAGLIEMAVLISAAAAHRRGDLDQAEVLLKDALDIAEQIREEVFAGMIRGWLGRIKAHRGQYEEAIALAEAALDGARLTGNITHRLAGTWGLLLTRYEGADPTLSVEQLDEGVAELSMIMYPALAADLAVAAAHLACSRGDLQRAESLVTEATRLAEGPLGGSAIGGALLARAMIESAGGNSDNALHLVHQAVAAMERVSDRLGMITALEDLAALVVMRSPRTARRLLEAAASERGQVGCPVPRVRAAFVHQTASMIESKLGPKADTEDQPRPPMSLENAIALARRRRGPRVRQAVGWASLTPTELRVGASLAEGCSNREIAERLHMSSETVKTHVAHILAKLGVRNRAGVAAAVTNEARSSAGNLEAEG